MEQRMELGKELPKGYQAMAGLEAFVKSSSLNKTIIELIKIRASQINGCAFCINMHTKDARANGETEQRIYALSAWRDTNFFTDEERAVLELTESVTLISSRHVSDEVYNGVARFYDKKGIGELILAIVTINAWNRIAISTQMLPE